MSAQRIPEITTRMAVRPGPVWTFEAFEKSGDSVVSSQSALIPKSSTVTDPLARKMVYRVSFVF